MMSDKPVVRVLASASDLAAAAAGDVAGIVSAVVARRNACTLALTGGGIARRVYEALAAGHRTSVPWHRVHFFWGDERHVPPDHPDSNFKMANDTLLRPLGTAGDHIHRIPAELADAAAAADAYDTTLRTFFGVSEGALPSFDLLLLGMGDDGHVASLFPGSDAVHSRDRLVLAPWAPHLGAYRITLSLPVLNAAAAVRLVVSGSKKADVLRRVLEEPREPATLPAQGVQPQSGDLVWMVDRQAAAGLTLTLPPNR
jgi:6-phosphogluconolactonase